MRMVIWEVTMKKRCNWIFFGVVKFYQVKIEIHLIDRYFFLIIFPFKFLVIFLIKFQTYPNYNSNKRKSKSQSRREHRIIKCNDNITSLKFIKIFILQFDSTNVSFGSIPLFTSSVFFFKFASLFIGISLLNFQQ